MLTHQPSAPGTRRPGQRTRAHVPHTSSCRAASVRRGPRAAAASGTATPLKDVLELLISRVDLSADQAHDAMLGMLSSSDFSPEQAAAFLVLLRAKGETPDEVAGLARAMLQNAETVTTQYDVVDIVGTGGDGIGSVNISTGACVIAAAAGARVAKHGSRSVSSLCGSAGATCRWSHMCCAALRFAVILLHCPA